MQEKAIKQKAAPGILFGVYWAVVSTFLRLILVDKFSLSFPAALGIALFVTALTAYPIFIQDAENRLTKDRPAWSFSSYFLFSLAVSVVGFLIALYFNNG